MAQPPTDHEADLPTLRPVRSADAEAVWGLLAPSTDELIGMSSLPHSLEAAVETCRASGATLADLATGSFAVAEGQARRLLFVIELTGGGDGSAARAVGLTGVTIKHRFPNLAVEVATSEDGLGLVMASSSAPWTRTELDSSFLAPEARGRGLGTLMSRGRFPFLHLVGSQIPLTVVAHLRGRFDDDGSAPFWRCFGANIASWPTSTDAERALTRQPDLLDDLAGHRRPLTGEVLDSLGPVNAASLPAFHLLQSEGLVPNGMYDPIDGGPTLVADLDDTVSGRRRVHGRARIRPVDPPGAAGTTGARRTDALVSVAGIDRFRVTRVPVELGDRTVGITRDAADALRVDDDALLTAVPLAGAEATASGPSGDPSGTSNDRDATEAGSA
ncbi:MAG: arginine N-succinyltransferase [Actinomycetota bacterium]